MSAFNTVLVPVICHTIGQVVELPIQFRYGNVWQYIYRLGDELRWGGNEVGDQEARKVVISGVAESCPACGYGKSLDDTVEYEIWVQDNKVVCALPATGRYNFFEAGEYYIVLEP